jgi:hypothetical protein
LFWHGDSGLECSRADLSREFGQRVFALRRSLPNPVALESLHCSKSPPRDRPSSCHRISRSSSHPRSISAADDQGFRVLALPSHSWDNETEIFKAGLGLFNCGSIVRATACCFVPDISRSDIAHPLQLGRLEIYRSRLIGLNCGVVDMLLFVGPTQYQIGLVPYICQNGAVRTIAAKISIA